MTKVLYVSHVSILGGAERSLLELLRHLDRSEWSPLVALPRHGALSEALEREGISFRFAPMRRFRRTRNPFTLMRYLLSTLDGAIALTRLARREGVELVHANSTNAHCYAGLAARLRRRPILWHLRDSVQLGGLSGPLGALATRVVTPSRWLSRVASEGKVPPHKVDVVYNGVDPTPFNRELQREPIRSSLGLTPGDFFVLMVAQMAPWKRHEVFIDIAAAVSLRLESARFAIAGGPLWGEDKPYADALKGRVRDHALRGVFRFLGPREDVPALMAAADAVVLPSVNEPFGRVAVEAMLAGTPVVAAASGALPEIVRDGESGLLFAPDDTREGVRHLLHLASDPEWRQNLGTRGRQVALRQFTAELCAERMATLYRSVLGRGLREGDVPI